MTTWIVRILGIAILCVATSGIAMASEEVKSTCRGNIETFDKKIIQTDVIYLLWYEISGPRAKIRFAGREFDALVEKMSSAKGHWIKRIDDSIYFSFVPEEGGTIKFQFEPNRWFSGNCQ